MCVWALALPVYLCGSNESEEDLVSNEIANIIIL